MKHRPILSFVIPAYNEEVRIGHCLDSILRELKRSDCQSEIIVVDNASTDRTKTVAGRYPGVKVVDEPTKGIVMARQRGLMEASGDLIANIDADTMLTPGWIGKVLNEFSRNKNLVCLSGPFIYYDLSSLERFWVKVFYAFGFLFYLLNRFILGIGSMVQGGNFVCRKRSLEKIGGYDTTISFYGEDTDIARRLHDIGDVKFTFSLPIYASGRRLKKEGFMRLGARYALNYFWVTIFKKPFTKTSIDVRPVSNK